MYLLFFFFNDVEYLLILGELKSLKRIAYVKGLVHIKGLINDSFVLLAALKRFSMIIQAQSCIALLENIQNISSIVWQSS